MKVAIYIVSKNAKQAYQNDCYEARIWPGISVLKHQLINAGIEVRYCGVADAHEQDVILVSVTSGCDWWPFVAERLRWKSGKYKVIAGGPGVLNIRPFLEFADCFVFGRAENLITDLIREKKYQHESVAWADDFSTKRQYVINQSSSVFAEKVILENGKSWKEAVIGCRQKCLFCGYTWQRRNIGGEHSLSTGKGQNFWGSHKELTMLDLDIDAPETWERKGEQFRIIAIDGFSERLRKKVNKPITREMIVKFFLGLGSLNPPHQIKIFNLVGLPTETDNDWNEFTQDMTSADSRFGKQKQWPIILHNTPFRPMPCTPVSHWPMRYVNYRGEIAKRLKQPGMKGNIFFQGNRFWAVESMGTDSLSAVALDSIVIRGTEADAKNIKLLSCSSSFFRADSATRLVTLEKYFDLKTNFGAYQLGKTPTEYLKAWWKK